MMSRRATIVVMLSIAVTGSVMAEDRVAWYGNWTEGLREAARTGRPILLQSAAPHCRQVSGIW